MPQSAFAHGPTLKSTAGLVDVGALETRVRAAVTAAWLKGVEVQPGDVARRLGRTRDALERIVSRASQISPLTTEITVVACEQPLGRGQVNRAINDVDKVTQQGAPMAEPSPAASRNPPPETEALSDSLSAFKSSITLSRSPRTAPRAQAPVAAQMTVGHRGSAAVRQPAPRQGADEWEEF